MGIFDFIKKKVSGVENKNGSSPKAKIVDTVPIDVSRGRDNIIVNELYYSPEQYKKEVEKLKQEQTLTNDIGDKISNEVHGSYTKDPKELESIYSTPKKLSEEAKAKNDEIGVKAMKDIITKLEKDPKGKSLSKEDLSFIEGKSEDNSNHTKAFFKKIEEITNATSEQKSNESQIKNTGADPFKKYRNTNGPQYEENPVKNNTQETQQTPNYKPKPPELTSHRPPPPLPREDKESKKQPDTKPRITNDNKSYLSNKDFDKLTKKFEQQQDNKPQVPKRPPPPPPGLPDGYPSNGLIADLSNALKTRNNKPSLEQSQTPPPLPPKPKEPGIG